MNPGRCHILFVVQTDWFLYLHFMPLVRGLLRAGWRVSVLCNVDDHRERLEAEGIEVVPLTHFNVSSLSPTSQLAATAELAQRIRQRHPDLVQLISPKPILLGSIAARQVGHRGVASLVTGLGFVFTGRSKKHELLQRAVLGGMRWGHAPKSSRMIFQNEEDRSLYLNSGVIPKKQSCIVPGVGTDLHRFQPGPRDNEVPVIVFGARMLRDKGVRELLEAARILRSSEIPFKLLFCGRPDPNNPSSLSEDDLLDAQSDGLIDYLGHVDRIEDVLHGADIACLPSYREGLPKFLMDAGAAGLPLVATDVPGCRSVVQHGHNGLLVPPRSAPALADALARLLTNREKRIRYGDRSRRRVQREFSQEQSVEQMFAVYRSILADVNRHKRCPLDLS